MQQQEGQWVVYLIHFDQPYYHARHYLGTTNDLEHRLQQHAKGRRYGGARLMEVIIQAGISWRVACTWAGGRELEQQLKAWNNGSRLCPICKANRIAEQVFNSTVTEQELAVQGWL
jgi:predicted GIY-YIG superfamily endonuclease